MLPQRVVCEDRVVRRTHGKDAGGLCGPDASVHPAFAVLRVCANRGRS